MADQDPDIAAIEAALREYTGDLNSRQIVEDLNVLQLRPEDEDCVRVFHRPRAILAALPEKQETLQNALDALARLKARALDMAE